MTESPLQDRLPPERELSDLIGRADRVIAEVGRETPPGRRGTGRVLTAVAAVAALVVSVLGIGVLHRAAEPSVTATPPAASPIPTPADPVHGSLRVGETVELMRGRITVSEVDRTKRGLAVKVETCVTDAPASQFPRGMSVGTSDWLMVRTGHSGVVVVWTQDPDRMPAYPNSFDLVEGECVAGWIPEMNPPGQGDISLIYRGDLGDSARWTIG